MEFLKVGRLCGAGEGFTNTGTRRNPVASEVESSKVRIALKKDLTNPNGYILDSAYPLYE